MTNKIITIDAGHGLYTAGKQTLASLGVVYKEWTLNDKVVCKVMSMLDEYEGVEVYRIDDATGKADVPLTTRVSKSNSLKAHVHISVHQNAGGGTGTEVYWHTYGTTEDKKLAGIVAPKLATKTGLHNRGVKQAQFAVLGCKATAILIEGGFMDTLNDYKVITSDKGQQGYAEAIVEGLVEYLGLKKKQVVTPTKPSIVSTNLTMLIRGKEVSQPIYSHPDATSQVVEHLKQGEMKTVFELSKDGHWGKIGENQWLGIDYVELFLAPFLYNPNNHKQKIYSHPDATSQVQGDLPSNKFTPILEVSANQWGRTAQGWVSLAYGGLIETSMLVKANKGKVNGYSHPDTTSKIIATLDNNIVVTVVELSADGNWGYCKSGYWIPLEVVTIL